ncbi:MAG TPA: L,D-transpeptidase [Acidimicrobiia bacterium]|nr:L,D-transpeptidase [Acidimicrobiia bacterium]
MHGTNAPTTIGAAQSNGCVHIANNFDTFMASVIKPGTLVEIG